MVSLQRDLCVIIYLHMYMNVCYHTGYYNGQLISARQPKLLTGGIMRDYQLDGMEWIQVSSLWGVQYNKNLLTNS